MTSSNLHSTYSYIIHIAESSNNGKLLTLLTQDFGKLQVYVGAGNINQRCFLYEAKLFTELTVRGLNNRYELFEFTFNEQPEPIITGLSSIFAMYSREVVFKYSIEIPTDQRYFQEYQEFIKQLRKQIEFEDASIQYYLKLKAICYRFELNLFGCIGTIDFLSDEFALKNFEPEIIYELSASIFIPFDYAQAYDPAQHFTGFELQSFAVGEFDDKIMLDRCTQFISLLRHKFFNKEVEILTEKLLTEYFQLKQFNNPINNQLNGQSQNNIKLV